MRRNFKVVMLSAAAAFAVVAAAASVSTKNKSLVPKFGLSTPGVKLPFANLKAEVEIPAPAKPAWLFSAESVFLPAADHVDRIDVKTNKAAEPINGLDKPCGGMVSAFSSLWAPLCGAKPGLARIDAKTYKVIKTIETSVSSDSGVIAASSDSIWLLTDDKTTLARIDPDQNSLVAEVRLPAACHHLIFGENALWLSCPRRNQVVRINPLTNLIERQIDVAPEPGSITVGEGSIWVLCAKDGKIDRIDPKTNKVTNSVALNVPHSDGMLAFGEGFLWATMSSFPLARIEVQGESVTVLQQFYGQAGGAIAITPGAIWLSNLATGTVSRIDPKRVRTILPE